MIGDGVLEIFLIAGCLGSGMDANVCDRSWDTYKNSNKSILLAEKNFNRMYLDPVPLEMKALGGSLYTFQRKQLDVNLYKGFRISVKDGGEGMFFFRTEIP